VQTAAKAATAGAATGAATAMEEAVTAGAATGVAMEAATEAGAATVMAEAAMAALERMSVLSAAAAYAAVESHSSTSREVLNRAFYLIGRFWPRPKIGSVHAVAKIILCNSSTKRRCSKLGEGRGLHVR